MTPIYKIVVLGVKAADMIYLMQDNRWLGGQIIL